ncbi:AlpA family phage regulatory protein [Geobacter pelophilus]|uniref:AlpA family phage regulatory protein n=1 Tax=Geoanaerobacter pelophilus TaxID=60036 RepID=A0AAW4L0K4_9BACT|nr:AlpA family phage regulatory protein [Geoanaerobacter pelophilus]MBT0664214.1 AlpA family phage regulatory protein [Geoanaerobacter pelophilus]
MKLLRIKQVLENVPVSKSTIWKWVKEDKFPAPQKMGCCTVWKEEDVQRFIDTVFPDHS